METCVRRSVHMRPFAPRSGEKVAGEAGRMRGSATLRGTSAPTPSSVMLRMTPSPAPRAKGVSPHRRLQIRIDLVEEARRRQPLLLRPDQQREVLRHEASLDGVDADL